MYRIGNLADSSGVYVETSITVDRRISTDLSPLSAASEGPIRALDVIVSALALIFFAPIMLLTAAAISIQDGAPVIFAQERIGRGGRKFKCYKFRSMVLDSQSRLAELLARDPEVREEWERDRKLRNDPRITWLGHILRKTSLDELPQLFNILRGEMSLVGPRPIVSDEVAKYGRAFRHYISITPGLTGLWQVSGRNDVEYARRVALDILYVRRRSLAFNLYIIAKTLPAVLLREGSY